MKDAEIEKLRNEKIINHTTNKTTNSNITNNININIMNYGKEDLSKLNLEKILKYNNAFVQMILRDIDKNSDIEIIDNKNTVSTSLSKYDIYIKYNNEWLRKTRNDKIDQYLDW